MYCRNCGAKLNDNDRFCTYCGALVSPANSENNQQAPTQVNYQSSSIERPTVNTPKATAALVCSIIGFIGIFFTLIPLINMAYLEFVFLVMIHTTLNVLGLVFGIQSIKFAAQKMRAKCRSVRSLVFGIVSVSLTGFSLIYDLFYIIAILAIGSAI